jgi:hypothetical protein
MAARNRGFASAPSALPALRFRTVYRILWLKAAAVNGAANKFLGIMAASRAETPCEKSVCREHRYQQF